MVLCGQIREDQEAPPYVRRVLHRERVPHADPEDPQVGRCLRTSLFRWYTHKLMDAHRKETHQRFKTYIDAMYAIPDSESTKL